MAADILDFKERLPPQRGHPVAFDSNSGLLAIGGRRIEDDSYKNLVRVWDVSICQETNRLYHNHTIAHLAFSPNSQMLAVGTSQIWWDWRGVGEVRLWDIDTGEERSFLNSGQVWSLFFSPDGDWLVVNANRILNTKTGREVSRIPNKNAYRAAFSADNRWMATGSLISGNDYISIWAWRPTDLIDRACARLRRNLTKEEWNDYLGGEPYRATCPHLPSAEG
ncbi:MAG: hypothetical protein AAF485_32385 [Chloroflexota bacterium]